MNKADFIANFLESSKNEGFSFLRADEQFADPQQMPAGKQALTAAAMASAFGAVFGGGALVGAIAGSNVGYRDHTKEEVVEDLRGMSQYCDLVGLSVSSGICIVRPVIDSDEIPHETLVGRFAMIHERVHAFRKYAMVLAKNWLWGDATSATYAQVFLAFSSHKKARDFAQHFADKCRHKSFTKMVYTYPCIVDLEDEEASMLSFGLIKFSAEKLKNALFRKRG